MPAYGTVGSVEDTDLAAFRREIDTNLFGTIIVTKAAIPILRAQRSGHIIQLSSVGGADRRAGAGALFGREMGRGRFFGIARARDDADWRAGDR